MVVVVAPRPERRRRQTEVGVTASGIHGIPACTAGETQDLFFIRHAESRWNRAQDNYSLVGMYSENDHGLTVEGLRQCEVLRDRLRHAESVVFGGASQFEGAPIDSDNVAKSGCFINQWERAWLQRLLRPNHVLSSPFTRAVQTAVIGFSDLIQRTGRLVVAREARETKNIGSADSRGVATGSEVQRRAEDEIRSLYAERAERSEVVVEEMRRYEIDVSEVTEAWWPTLMDSEESVSQLQGEFLEKLRRLGPGSSSIVVGHSHFFRRFFETHLSELAWREQYDVSASLCKVNVPAAGCIGLRLLWDGRGGVAVIEALPLLGTILQPAPPRPPTDALSLVCVRSGVALPSCCGSRRHVRSHSPSSFLGGVPEAQLHIETNRRQSDEQCVIV